MTSGFYIHVHKHQYTSKDYVHINHINTQEGGGDRQIRPWNRKKSPITNTCIEEHEGNYGQYRAVGGGPGNQGSKNLSTPAKDHRERKNFLLPPRRHYRTRGWKADMRGRLQGDTKLGCRERMSQARRRNTLLTIHLSHTWSKQQQVNSTTLKPTLFLMP